jgi:predicted Rossmann fold nucleotide-binding protein DprA/Smf involved in DNA uptake
MLIKEGAIIALSPEDMAAQASYFEIPEDEKNEIQQENLDFLDKDELAVLELISKSDEGIHTDEIAQQLSIEISHIAAIILKLEINSLIKSMPGQLYVKVR